MYPVSVSAGICCLLLVAVLAPTSSEAKHILAPELNKYPCGVSKFPMVKPANLNRISNGWEAAKHSFPWQVFMMFYDSPKENRGSQCGGSLIRLKPGNVTDLVLTAAHCVMETNSRRLHPKERMVVVPGVHDRTDPYRTKVRVQDVKAGDFKGGEIDRTNDIALLRLKQAVPYTDYTRPVCLPDKDDKLPVKLECYVAGHGTTSVVSSITENKLQMVDVNVLTAEECAKQMDEAKAKKFNFGTQFCAGTNYRSARAGDSGSPLVCKKNGVFVQYGIVSYGTADVMHADRAGKYTFLPPFLEWIMNTEKSLKQSEGSLSPSDIQEYLTQAERIKLENNKTLSAIKKPGPTAPKPVKPAGGYRCGVPAEQYPILLAPVGMNRIVNGWEAEKHSLPWMVIVHSPNPTNKLLTQSCGGTLIALQPGNKTDLVLTAAHCIKKQKDSPLPDAKDMNVLVGIHHQYADDSFKKEVSVKAYKLHEKYDAEKFYNDIALLRLGQSVPYTDITRPICLPQKGEEVKVGTECIVSGWGRTSHYSEALETELRMVTTKVGEFEECKQNLPMTIFKEQLVCAKADQRRGFCYGDSGGPLACKHGDQWFQQGIVSFSPQRCASTFDKYARVSNYIDWILKQDKYMPPSSSEFPYEDLTEYKSPMELVTGTRKPSRAQTPSQAKTPSSTTPSKINQPNAPSSGVKTPVQSVIGSKVPSRPSTLPSRFMPPVTSNIGQRPVVYSRFG